MVKKILQFSKFYPPGIGGIEQVAYDIVKGINRSQTNHCDVLCFHHKMRSDSEQVMDQGASIFRMKTWKVIASTPISLSIFTKYFSILSKYDVVHFHVPNPLGTIAAILTFNKKIVVHWHSDIVKQKMMLRFFRPLQNLMLRKADVIIVTSDKYGKESEQLANFQDKVVTVPIGIDFDSYMDNLEVKRRLIEKYKNRKVIFSLGRLAYYKGFEYLIQSAKYLPDNYSVVIGGSGELHDELQNLIDDNDLQNKVQLLGRIEANELSAWYQVADVFCMSSIEKSEAFGVVQLEAMSNSLPVVSTRIVGSGVDWVNLDGESGLTVEPRDDRALASAFMRICEDADFAQRLAEGAYGRYQKLFTADKMCAGIENVYNTL
nr:glycosyltransferase [Erwinia sp. S38]